MARNGPISPNTLECCSNGPDNMYRLTTDTFTLNLIEFVSFLRVLLGQKSAL